MKRHARALLFVRPILLISFLALSIANSSAQQSPGLISAPPPTQQPDAASSAATLSEGNKSRENRLIEGERYLIGPGDVLNILVIGKPQFSREGVVVGDDGTILMPFINEEVKVSCRTEKEIAKDIAERIQPYLVNPAKVSVTIKEYQALQVAVLGAVRNPSRFQLKRPMRLLDLLTLVNGPSETAGRTIQIVHTQSHSSCDAPTAASTGAGQSKEAVAMEVSSLEFLALKDTLLGEERANPYVRSGDIISIAPADQVYVIGNVVRPTNLALREPITVSRAIAMAGGTAQDAKKDQVRIIRQESNGNSKREIVVDLRAVEKHQAEDVLLLANDIVEVPTSGGKRLLHSLIGAVVPSIGQLPVRVIP